MYTVKTMLERGTGLAFRSRAGLDDVRIVEGMVWANFDRNMQEGLVPYRSKAINYEVMLGLVELCGFSSEDWRHTLTAVDGALTARLSDKRGGTLTLVSYLQDDVDVNPFELGVAPLVSNASDMLVSDGLSLCAYTYTDDEWVQVGSAVDYKAIAGHDFSERSMSDEFLEAQKNLWNIMLLVYKPNFYSRMEMYRHQLVTSYLSGDKDPLISFVNDYMLYVRDSYALVNNLDSADEYDVRVSELYLVDEYETASKELFSPFYVDKEDYREKLKDGTNITNLVHKKGNVVFTGSSFELDVFNRRLDGMKQALDRRK